MKRATGETLGLRDPALAPHRPLVLDIGSRPHLAEVTPVGMELSTCIPGPLTECLRRAIGAFNERHETLPFGMVGAASDVADAVDRAEAFYGTPPPGVDDALLYEFFREGGVCTHMMRELNEFILAKFAGDAVLFAPWLGSEEMTGIRGHWTIPTSDGSWMVTEEFVQPGMKFLTSCGSAPGAPVRRINPERLSPRPRRGQPAWGPSVWADRFVGSLGAVDFLSALSVPAPYRLGPGREWRRSHGFNSGPVWDRPFPTTSWDSWADSCTPEPGHGTRFTIEVVFMPAARVTRLIDFHVSYVANTDFRGVELLPIASRSVRVAPGATSARVEITIDPQPPERSRIVVGFEGFDSMGRPIDRVTGDMVGVRVSGVSVP